MHFLEGGQPPPSRDDPVGVLAPLFGPHHEWAQESSGTDGCCQESVGFQFRLDPAGVLTFGDEIGQCDLQGGNSSVGGRSGLDHPIPACSRSQPPSSGEAALQRAPTPAATAAGRQLARERSDRLKRSAWHDGSTRASPRTDKDVERGPGRSAFGGFMRRGSLLHASTIDMQASQHRTRRRVRQNGLSPSGTCGHPSPPQFCGTSHGVIGISTL